PAAASSPNAWRKAGIAPYSTYFAHLSEYLSPGNGLLTIRQDDLYLPGRGIDLDIARVFSTPYAFRSGSPYQYDNFTLSNLGYGWSLDFPWLGANYLHLSGGQVYPYQWSGNVFEYHAGNDFKLLHNADGSFTLSPRAGTQYQFNTGINNWLIGAVLYPTGGKSTYTYGSAAVGTENVRTYYVTSRNIYASPVSLSQSSSTSYRILDGNVVWSNTTVSDGVSTRG